MISLSAQPVKADKAYEWGLLDELVMVDNDKNDYGSSNAALTRGIELANAIATNNALMVRRYKRAIVEGGNVDHQRGLQRERELGLAHYLEIVGDGETFEGAKEFISDDGRPRMQSRL